MSDVKLLFVDTEFTMLDWSAKLISIAVVTETEQEFYTELDDNYSLADCSQFVIANVLPHLTGSSVEQSYEMAGLNLSRWIESLGVPCMFATDAPYWDMKLVIPMLNKCWPENLHREVFHAKVSQAQKNVLFAKHKFTPHFALHDAIVNKRAIVG